MIGASHQQQPRSRLESVAEKIERGFWEADSKEEKGSCKDRS
jgi:hypothetical protein